VALSGELEWQSLDLHTASPLPDASLLALFNTCPGMFFVDEYFDTSRPLRFILPKIELAKDRAVSCV
jgi:hypothetical protein